VKDFDFLEAERYGLLHDLAGRLVRRAGAVDDRVTVVEEQFGMLEDVFGGDPSRTGDDLGVGEQIQRLTNIDYLHGATLVCGEEDGVQLIDIDGVGFEEEPFAPAPTPFSDS